MQVNKNQATRQQALQLSVAALSWPLSRAAYSRTEQRIVAAMRAQLGIPEKFGSCHTGKIDSYAQEGHVPAADIKRLLEQRPVAVGLAVPGMPMGPPGMDGPAYGGRRDPYAVMLIGKDGTATVFQAHG